MPWSGGVYTRTNGTYNGSTVWASDAAASIKIQSSRHDTHDQDLANGINACVAKDGSNTVTALNLTATVDANTGVINIGGINFANMAGTQNCFVGGAGNFTASGIGSNGFGLNSLLACTTGGANSAFGFSTLKANTTGDSNSAFGSSALLANIGGSNNTAGGVNALGSNTSGIGNSAFGAIALQTNISGNYNIGVGYDSLQSITSGSKNVGIGYEADVPSATADGQLSIQNAIYGTGNTGTLTTVSTGNIGLYTTAPTARLHLPAGTATAGTAPLKLTAGTNLTTPENGALEFDGTHLYITIGGVRTTIV